MALVAVPEDPRPWYVGHNGATNFTRGEAQKFARNLLESKDYRESLKERIHTKTLPPAVETMLWHYAYGKPVEQVNLSIGTEDLSGLSVDELVQRARALQDQLEEVRRLEDAIPAQYKVG